MQQPETKCTCDCPAENARDPLHHRKACPVFQAYDKAHRENMKGLSEWMQENKAMRPQEDK